MTEDTERFEAKVASGVMTLMSELFSLCQPNAGDVFGWFDEKDRARIVVRAILREALE